MIIITVVCLIRHGETDWNALGRIQGRTDIPLNKFGIKQAEACRVHFQTNDDWNVIISSTLSRAKHTAEIINQGLSRPFIEMEEFIERGFGDAEGMTIEERRNKYPDGNYPNQEEDEVLLGRIVSGLDKIHQTYQNQKVLLVVHGGVINAILEFLSSGELGFGKSKLQNASLSHIVFENGEWKLRDYNQVSHLDVVNIM